MSNWGPESLRYFSAFLFQWRMPPPPCAPAEYSADLMNHLYGDAWEGCILWNSWLVLFALDFLGCHFSLYMFVCWDKCHEFADALLRMFGLSYAWNRTVAACYTTLHHTICCFKPQPSACHANTRYAMPSRVNWHPLKPACPRPTQQPGNRPSSFDPQNITLNIWSGQHSDIKHVECIPLAVSSTT